MSFVNTVDVIGDEALTNSIIDRSITEISDNLTTSIGGYAFYFCSQLTTVDFPVATSIGSDAFYYCSQLTTADFPVATSIGSYAFNGCSKLTTLILRSATMCTLSGTNAFASTPIASGTGYIYVPRALVDSYKAASNWSTYANQFRALEDYTVDGTITGVFDIFKATGIEKYSWDGVLSAIDAGAYATLYSIGDSIPLDLGSEGTVNMQIVAFDTDDLADGTGKTPITFIAEELLTTKHRMNPGTSGTTEGTGCIGGWDKCEMRTYLNDTIKPMIPTAVAARIAVVNKTHDAYDTTGSAVTQTTADDVWIPSDTEVLDSDCVYNSLYTDDDSRVKCIAGSDSAASWWMRNSYSKNTYGCIHSSGMDISYMYTADTQQGVCLGFCIK